ncbi:MAG: DUF4093 domain-containing protein, partial [Clostridiales bacterium]|nr:DUF4093 domain-containing protein [Clostridiales bacterium]
RPEVLEAALRRAGATILDEDEAAPLPRREITKADFFRDGLTGRPDSAARRERLKSRLELPQRLTANGLLEVLNVLYSYEDYEQVVARMDDET